ncbi:MAG: cobalt ECF transporter T component CbiQ [Actinomycetota bacterium]|nr:cobalt ECF transporter T component CbiQ [Actinomycetota bacterium]
MGGAHGGVGAALHRPADTPAHRLPAHVKLLALLGFVAAVVSTPREAFWAFGVHAAVVAVACVVARVPAGWLARRMVVETPFLVFALVLPFVAGGPRVEVLGAAVSHAGLLAAWNVVAKGTLGVAACAVLAATTSPRDLLLGLQRLRAPALLVEIFAFMVRYADVVVDEMRRMRIAREARGFEGRHVGHVRVLARSAGALFIRSYERGERVHLAMLSRGYAGRLPVLDARPAGAPAWATASVLPAAAVAVALVAWVVR